MNFIGEFETPILQGGIFLSNKNIYIKSIAGITLIKSCDNVDMTLIAAISKLDNTDMALILLEDIKKDLIAYLGSRGNNAYPIDGNIFSCKFTMPESLYNKLATRAESEKCSLDALCVYILSNYLSGTLK